MYSTIVQREKLKKLKAPFGVLHQNAVKDATMSVAFIFRVISHWIAEKRKAEWKKAEFKNAEFEKPDFKKAHSIDIRE